MEEELREYEGQLEEIRAAIVQDESEELRVVETELTELIDELRKKLSQGDSKVGQIEPRPAKATPKETTSENLGKSKTEDQKSEPKSTSKPSKPVKPAKPAKPVEPNPVRETSSARPGDEFERSKNKWQQFARGRVMKGAQRGARKKTK